MHSRIRSLAIASFLAMFLLGMAAQGAYIGVGWVVSDAVARNATLANAQAQAGNPNKVVFSASALQFDSRGTDGTVGSFLSSKGALIGAAAYSGSLDATDPLNGPNAAGMLFQFTGVGAFTNGMTFELTQDDGVQFYVGGALVFDNADPTAPVTNTFTYTGPSGNLPFTFVYGECCSLPAVLITDLVPPDQTVPEPASVVLFASGLVVAFVLRRRHC